MLQLLQQLLMCCCSLDGLSDELHVNSGGEDCKVTKTIEITDGRFTGNLRVQHAVPLSPHISVADELRLDENRTALMPSCAMSQ